MKLSPLPLVSALMADAMELRRSKFPKVVRIETTNHCNAACTFCPRESIGRDKTFMDQELYEKIIDECGANGCRVVHLHNFGEPLLDKRLPDRIRLAKERGIPKVKIFCNGALLRGKIAERLLESGLDEIKVSIDGANAQEFNQLRIGLDHASVVDNTRNFKRMRDEENGGKGPRIVAACTVTSKKKDTQRLLDDVVDGVDYARLHNWGGGRRIFGDRKYRKPCDRLWRTFTILVNGDVALCCLDFSGKEILGNCREDTITDIWQSEGYRKLRFLDRTSRQDEISVCNNCSKCYF